MAMLFRACVAICGGQLGDAAAATFTLRPAAVMLVMVGDYPVPV